MFFKYIFFHNVYLSYSIPSLKKSKKLLTACSSSLCCSCAKTLTKTNLGQKGLISSYTILLSKEGETGTQRETAVRSWSRDHKRTPNWLAFSGFLSFSSYKDWAQPFMVGIGHNELGFLHQLPIKKMLSQTWPQTKLIETLPQLRFPLPRGVKLANYPGQKYTLLLHTFILQTLFN